MRFVALGSPRTNAHTAEAESLRLRRSLYVATNVVSGELITEENVRSVRPNGGLAPVEIYKLLGKRFRADAEVGTPMSWSLVEPDATNQFRTALAPRFATRAALQAARRGTKPLVCPASSWPRRA